jgi:diaminopimelate decarboxylase
MSFSYIKNVLHAENIPLQKIAERFGTPTYVYSAARLKENVGAYQRAFNSVLGRKNYTLCFATKSCSNIAVLSFLKSLGCGADIVSGGEMIRALKAGINPDKIVFSGVGKSEDELEQAVRAGLFMINVESAEELHALASIAKRLKKVQDIAIRVNPNVDAKTHAKITTGTKENKFGIDIDHAAQLYKQAQKLKSLRPRGVAVHIGSQLTRIAPYAQAYKRLAILIEDLKKQGVVIDRIDIGGGIGIRYQDESLVDMAAYARMVKKHLGGFGAHIILEPGRSISADAGALLTKTVFVKHGVAKNFLILDAGMNDLMRPALYDAYHALWPVKKSGKKAVVYDVVGPVCETGDTFMTNEKLPQLAAGDLCAFMNAGAYGASMASNYNTRGLAAEILVDGKRIWLIRERQAAADILSLEKIPDWAG